MGLLLLHGHPSDRFYGSGQAFRVLPDGRREESSAFPLAAEVTLLGRSEHAGVDVLLAYSPVNRQHAVIRRRPDGYYIEDLHSRNGTTINGERLASDAPRKLEEGDRIEITGYVFEFRSADAASA
jgi:pSer/pThr/pTyr-binding forkhead associated (FHA) protein